VGTASAKSGLVARRYASALIDMATDAKAVDKVEKDLRELQSMIDSSPDLKSLLENPLVNRDQQQKALQAITAKAGFQKLTSQFIGVLSENRRLAALPAIIGAFNDALAKSRGEVKAKVETAYALTPAQTKQLQEQLAAAMGSNVTLDVSVNKDLLGGMIVTVGSRMVDDSVKRKLERLRRAMNANENAGEKKAG
jgi:F-type H+-transporting ATPase subunit delta